MEDQDNMTYQDLLDLGEPGHARTHVVGEWELASSKDDILTRRLIRRDEKALELEKLNKKLRLKLECLQREQKLKLERERRLEDRKIRIAQQELAYKLEVEQRKLARKLEAKERKLAREERKRACEQTLADAD